MAEIPKDAGNVSIKRVSPSDEKSKGSSSDKSQSGVNKSLGDKSQSLSKSEKGSSDKKKRAIKTVNNTVSNQQSKRDEHTAKTEVEREAAEDKKQSESLRKAFKAGVKSVPVAAGVGLGMKMLMMLKGLMMGLAQMALAALHAVSGFFSTIATSLAGVVTTVANFLGVGFTTAAIGLGGVTAGGVVSLVMVGIMLVNSSMAGTRDQLIGSGNKCSTEFIQDLQDDLDLDAETQKRFKTMYKAFSEAGVPDINIAGCFGNFACEGGGVDSTAVEGIYGNENRYKMTAKKRQIMSSADEMRVWCEGTLFPGMDKSGASYSKNAYKKSNGDYQCGIGMAQWTAGSAERFLKTANSVNADWWDFDFQVAFILTQNGPTGNALFKHGIQGWTEPCATAAEAALLFAEKYEGNTSNAQEKRVQKAEEFYQIIVTDWSLSPLEKLGNGIMGFLSKLATAVDKVVTGEELSKCASTSSIQFGDPGGGYYGYPTDSHAISANFPNYSDGSYHGGIDFPVPTGSNIYAAYDGVVVVAKYMNTSYGNHVIIEHPDGYFTLYGHNSELLVKVGDTVSRGQVIAKSGSTGNSTGPHCHFEVRTENSSSSRVDPNPFLSDEVDEPEET